MFTDALSSNHRRTQIQNSDVLDIQSNLVAGAFPPSIGDGNGTTTPNIRPGESGEAKLSRPNIGGWNLVFDPVSSAKPSYSGQTLAAGPLPPITRDSDRTTSPMSDLPSPDKPGSPSLTLMSQPAPKDLDVSQRYGGPPNVRSGELGDDELTSSNIVGPQLSIATDRVVRAVAGGQTCPPTSCEDRHEHSLGH